MPDLRTFRRICSDAARRTGGDLREFRIATGVTPSFHQAVIGYADRAVAVAGLRELPLLAIAAPRVIDPDRDAGPLTFVDHPGLAAALAEAPGWTVLTTARLDGPFHAAEWPGVSTADIRYWQPGSLGEALFNYWD